MWEAWKLNIWPFYNVKLTLALQFAMYVHVVIIIIISKESIKKNYKTQLLKYYITYCISSSTKLARSPSFVQVANRVRSILGVLTITSHEAFEVLVSSWSQGTRARLHPTSVKYSYIHPNKSRQKRFNPLFLETAQKWNLCYQCVETKSFHLCKMFRIKKHVFIHY